MDRVITHVHVHAHVHVVVLGLFLNTRLTKDYISVIYTLSETSLGARASRDQAGTMAAGPLSRGVSGPSLSVSRAVEGYPGVPVAQLWVPRKINR